MSDTITVIAIFEPKAHLLGEFIALIEPMIEGSNDELGCLGYDLYEDDGGRFYLLEEYVDQEALEAHRQSGHYAAYRAHSGDVLAAPVEVHVIHPARRSPSA
jgi:quinol monooxygenase YgiN